MTPTEKDDLVSRLGYHHEDQVTGKLVLRNPDGPEAAARITGLQAQLKEAREALKAFYHYEPWMDDWGDDVAVSTFKSHTFGDLRRAARAYANKGE